MISVGVMGYNQESFVREAMDSILAQQCSYPFEIVIGDDASTDNTRAILEEYQQKHPDIIRLLPKAPNKGVLKNYASVIKACTGKYIAFCHCDDYWHDPLKLQKQVDFLKQKFRCAEWPSMREAIVAAQQALVADAAMRHG